MTNLKWLNLYREKFNEDWDGEAASIYDNMNVLSEDEAVRVVAYLERGVVVAAFVSPTWDNVNPQDEIPHIVYKDDRYVWDGIIVHWVKKYRIRLPEEFMAHVSEKSVFPDQDNSLAGLIEIEDVKGAESLLLR